MEQVDLLCDGMLDVPVEAITLAARNCGWKVIQQKIGKKKNTHPWNELPGKAAAAFKRVKSRPNYFVSTLNPKVNDPWTIEDSV